MTYATTLKSKYRLKSREAFCGILVASMFTLITSSALAEDAAKHDPKQQVECVTTPAVAAPQDAEDGTPEFDTAQLHGPTEVSGKNKRKVASADVAVSPASTIQWVEPTAEETYPDAARRAADRVVHAEKVKAEEREQHVREAKDELDKQKAEAVVIIEQKKQELEIQRKRQHEADLELAALNHDLTEVNGQIAKTDADIANVKQKDDMQMAENEKLKATLEQKQKEQRAALTKLYADQSQIQKNIAKAQVEMAQMRTDIARAENDIARADNDRSRAIAEEVQTRTAWSAMQVRLNQAAADRRAMYNELQVAQERLKASQEDLRVAKNDEFNAEKANKELEAKVAATRTQVAAEVNRIGQAIAMARSNQVAAEAGQARYSAEIEKLKSDEDTITREHDQAMASASNSESMVNESRVQFETARAELVAKLAQTQSERLVNDTQRIKVREIASIDTAPAQNDAHRSGLVIQKCILHAEPEKNGTPLSHVKPGDQITVAPTGATYLKVFMGDNEPAYINKNCVKIKE